MTADEVEKMKRQVGSLCSRLDDIQCSKPVEVKARTADILYKYGHNSKTRTLKGWSCQTMYVYSTMNSV